MHVPLKRREMLGWLGASLALSSGGAHAQSYPNKAVRIIVGAAPGGPGDFMARAFGDAATPALGQPFVVDNKPGASGTLAATLASKAAADGYTLMIGSPAPMIVAPHLFAKLDYDPVKDFVPVSMLGAGAFVLAVHPSLPVNSLSELIAYAKARPGVLNYGSGGSGSSGQLCTESFAARVGAEFTHVPYKGDGLAVNDLLAGQIQIMFTAPNVAVPHHKSGKLKLLAVTSRERMNALPELPAVHEVVPDFEYLGWIILFAPARTPQATVDVLANLWNQALGQAGVKSRLDGLGMYPPERYASRESLAGMLRGERVRTEALIKKLGITPA